MTTENNELEALALQAAGIDGELAATSPESILQDQEAAAVVGMTEENVQAVGMMLQVAVPLLGQLYPSLREVYTPEACGAIAGTIGPVLSKHGISMKDWGGAYKEEIAMVIVCGPIAWATVQGIKTDIKRRADAATPAALQVDRAPPAPGAKPGDVNYREPVPVNLG